MKKIVLRILTRNRALYQLENLFGKDWDKNGKNQKWR